jgi:hypothetical protein
VRRYWDSEEEDDDAAGGGESIRTVVTGTGAVDGSSIRKVGSAGPAVSQLTVRLDGYASPAELSTQWQRRRANSLWPTGLGATLSLPQTVDPEIVRLNKLLFDRYSAKAATMVLVHLPADAETRQEDSWTLQCSLPQPILDALVHDVVTERCHATTIACDMHPTLIDFEYATPWDHATFGVYNGRGYGWLSSIQWDHAGSRLVEA